MTTAPAFTGFPKLPRLRRAVTVTEKIDGTNASIHIAPDCAPFDLGGGKTAPFLVGSRTRWIRPECDNFGFAAWALAHADELLALGPGQHFGEWWGRGIQRGYGLAERRWSLFNTARWKVETPPPCCSVVPVLAELEDFDTAVIDEVLCALGEGGSVAAPGFGRPEGVVVWHSAARVGFKRTLENDDVPKSCAPGARNEVTSA